MEHPPLEVLDDWGTRVAARRRLLHLTQAELAELVGVDQAVISRLESGRLGPRDIVKWRVAGALSCPVGDLFPWPKTKPPAPERAKQGSAA